MRTCPPSTVFTRAELRADGWTDSALSRAIRSGRLVRLRRGYLAAAPRETDAETDAGTDAGTDPRLAIIAAVRAGRDGVASHRSALLLHGLPLVGPAPSVPEVTVPPRQLGGLLDAHLYRATLRDEDVTSVDGLPVTSIARTLVDIGRHRSTATAVVAIDAALHTGRVTAAELNDVSLTCWNWPRIRRALRAIRLADARAESPLESVSRLVLPRLGIPAPTLQPTILDERGLVIGRLDFYWDEFGVAGEADGRSKYDVREVLVREKERQERLENAGLVVVRWGWVDATRRRPLLRARLAQAFERGRRRDRSGFRRAWSVSAG